MMRDKASPFYKCWHSAFQNCTWSFLFVFVLKSSRARGGEARRNNKSKQTESTALIALACGARSSVFRPGAKQHSLRLQRFLVPLPMFVLFLTLKMEQIALK